MDKKDIKLEALKKKLTEIFQLDKADLDFGIYRILNQKRKDVEHFIQTDLPEIVNEELVKYDSGKNAELQSELDNAIKNAKDLGVDPESTDKVKELRSQLKTSITKEDIEAEVYSALTDFFSRYYDEGDFISQRRYKDGVYAIPYEGEEVKLHWANADQYYIKTTEDFANFSFYIDEAQTKRVSFQIAKAETEKDNNKEADSKKRRFALISDAPVELVDDTIVIRFTYEVSNSKQESLNQQAEEQVKQLLPQEFSALFAKAPTEKDKNRTVFGKWLGHYTSKNTFDYFIHKDLRGFLSRELDFYIKNELLRIDDLDAFAEATNSRLVSKIKVFKHIAETVIAFLAQLENLQKKLWEKKRFVIQSDYILTLHNINESLYDSILNNNDQVNEWVKLGLVEEGLSIDIEYLKNHKTLQIDTKHFPDLKNTILGDNIDDKITGLLVNSDNFAGLNTLHAKYQSSIKLAYADPPYNAPGTSEILYKNNFFHSSWLALMYNRILSARKLLNTKGVSIVAIDENEHDNLAILLKQIFPGQKTDTISIVHNPSGIQSDNISVSNDYAIFTYPNQKRIIGQEVRTNDEDIRNFRDVTGDDSLRTAGKNCFYPIYINDGEIVGFGDVSEDDYHPGSTNVLLDDGRIAVYPVDPQGIERKWRYARNTVEPIRNQLFAHYLSTRDIWDIKRKKNTFNFKTVWNDSKYSANNHGTQLLNNIMGTAMFDYPKSIYTMMDCIRAGMSAENNGIVLDYFAGSGTTGHAAIKLNKEDDGSRFYILIEMGSYFDTVTKPRIQKVIYSDDWKNGKPQDAGMSGSSQVVKYIKLESYEDALNNLKFTKQTDAQRSLLENDKTLERNYRINYMLDFESQDSRSLLDIKQFEDPFNYEMLIQDDSNRLIPKNVDLVDTFNYLIGLNVDHIEQKKGFIVVHGKQNDGTRTLIIWRNVNENPNEKLNEFLEKSAYNPRDGEFDVIFVNGDNNVENLQTADDAWKVRLIEEEFHKRMFN